MEVALINEALFIENSPIKEDTIITKFIPYILIAQKMYIRPIIGIPLYEELQTQIKAASVVPAPDPNPITPANRALIVALAPALSMYAVYQGLPFHWASIMNKGLTVRESENSNAVTINELAQLRRWIKDDAEQQVAALMDYLGNCTDYPLYKPNCGPCGDGGGSVSPFDDGGIFIPRR